MRLSTFRALQLCAIALLAGATGVAADSLPQGPLAERGTKALGFDLRSGGSFGLWKVRSPYTALGLEASLYWGLTENDYETPALSDRRSQRLCMELRPTLKRYRTLRNGIAPYVYVQGLGRFSGSKTEYRGSTRETTTSMIDLGGGLGLGVDWFPLERISVGGRTGLSLRYGFGDSSRWVTSSTGVSTRHPSSDRALHIGAFASRVTAFVYF